VLVLVLMLNRTHHHLIRGCRDSGGGRGGGGFVSRCSQKHNLTPDEHLPFLCMRALSLFCAVVVVAQVCSVFAPTPPQPNTKKKLTTTVKRGAVFRSREAKNEEDTLPSSQQQRERQREEEIGQKQRA
jgi:hypothetical protein